MIRRSHKPKTSVPNGAITESPQAAFARHRRTQLGREVLRYNDHVPEFPSPTFLDRFVDFPFDIAARFADLNIAAKSVLRDEDVAFMRAWDDALRAALRQPVSMEAHVMNTRDAMRRARASVAADSFVPAEVKPIIIHGLDAGWFQAALTNPRVTGHLPSGHSSKSLRTSGRRLIRAARPVLGARFAPQMAEETLLTAPEWIRQKYLPLFYSRQAVLTIAMSLPFPNADAWREQHGTRSPSARRTGARSCAVARLLALRYQCALHSPTPPRSPTSLHCKRGSCRSRGKSRHDALERRPPDG